MMVKRPIGYWRGPCVLFATQVTLCVFVGGWGYERDACVARAAHMHLFRVHVSMCVCVR